MKLVLTKKQAEALDRALEAQFDMLNNLNWQHRPDLQNEADTLESIIDLLYYATGGDE